MPRQDSKNAEQEDCESFLKSQQHEYPTPELKWIGNLQKLDEPGSKGN